MPCPFLSQRGSGSATRERMRRTRRVARPGAGIIRSGDGMRVPAGTLARAIPGGRVAEHRHHAAGTLYGQPMVIDDCVPHGARPHRPSLHARQGVETTNGDGFGIGWYGDGDAARPAATAASRPAWSDANLRDIAAHVALAAVPRAHPRDDGHAGAADELPPVPARALAVRAQRRHRRVRRDAARPDARGRPAPVRRRSPARPTRRRCSTSR